MLPERYIDNMKELLGDELDDYLKVFERKAYRGIRFNKTKLKDKEEQLNIYNQLCSDEAIPVPWTENGYYLPETVEASKSPFYALGLYYIQEPSAMSPAAYLRPNKNELVLDLCAAPGGKATELASNCGFLFANDISASRAQALLKNLELSGNDNFAVTAESPEHLAASYPKTFDCILVDAPCSGEGMFLKESGLINSWLERGPVEYHGLQTEILEQAYRMLKPGGRMLFSTCTFSPIENEGRLKVLLENHNDLKLIPLPDRYEYFRPGLNGYDAAARLYPFIIKGEGHFLALLQKAGENDAVNVDYTSHCIKRIEDRLYLVPAALEFKKGIRFLRTGLFLGEYKKDKFRPSEALALSLGSKIPDGIRCFTADDFSFEYYAVSLKKDDDRVLRYLKGETIFMDDIEGLGKYKGDCLICVEGFPLGFGRIAGLRLKNDYPQGYIWQ